MFREHNSYGMTFGLASVKLAQAIMVFKGILITACNAFKCRFDHIVNFVTFAYHHKQYEILNYYQLYGCHVSGNHTVESPVVHFVLFLSQLHKESWLGFVEE